MDNYRLIMVHCGMVVQVDELIAKQQLDLTEDEYALLIGVCAHGASWDRAQEVLNRIARELTTLQNETLAAVEQYFRCAASTHFALARDFHEVSKQFYVQQFNGARILKLWQYQCAFFGR